MIDSQIDKEKLKRLCVKRIQYQLEKDAQFVSTEETRKECRMILDTHLGSEYDGELYQQYFIR